MPHAKVYVHERGLKHLADPTRLVASAREALGPQEAEIFGTMQPIPADRLVAVKDGDRLDLGKHVLVFAGAFVLAGAVVSPVTVRAAGADPAPATPATTVDTLTDEGLAAYRRRDYRHAAEKFLQGYAMQPDPNLLFNLGRCYEALGDRVAALEKYRLFLASPDIEPIGRRRAENAIRALSVRAAPPVVAEPARELPARPVHPAQSALPYLGIASGAAAMATGAVIYALGMLDHQEVIGAKGYGVPGAVDVMTEVAARRLADSARSKKIIGGTALAVGGAVLAVSLAVVLSAPDGKEGRMALAVSPESGGGSLVLAGRF